MSVLNSKRTYLKAEDRRSQILEVAKAVFAKQGYHEANIADICEAAHIGRGTLYQYFQNKRDVLLGVVDQICARIQSALAKRPPIPSAEALAEVPLETIVSFSAARFREILDAVFLDEDALRLVLREARGLDGGIDAVISRIDALVLGAIEDDVRAAQDANILRSGIDPKLTALFFLGGVEKVVLAAVASGGPIDLDALVQKIGDIELFGLLNQEKRP